MTTPTFVRDRFHLAIEVAVFTTLLEGGLPVTYSQKEKIEAIKLVWRALEEKTTQEERTIMRVFGFINNNNKIPYKIIPGYLPDFVVLGLTDKIKKAFIEFKTTVLGKISFSKTQFFCDYLLNKYHPVVVLIMYINPKDGGIVYSLKTFPDSLHRVKKELIKTNKPREWENPITIGGEQFIEKISEENLIPLQGGELEDKIFDALMKGKKITEPMVRAYIKECYY